MKKKMRAKLHTGNVKDHSESTLAAATDELVHWPGLALCASQTVLEGHRVDHVLRSGSCMQPIVVLASIRSFL